MPTISSRGRLSRLPPWTMDFQIRDQSFSFPASKVLQLVYNGGYSKIGDAHMALGKYMKDKALTQNVAVEEYITDPMTEKDSTKWQTNIYYLLK